MTTRMNTVAVTTLLAGLSPFALADTLHNNGGTYVGSKSMSNATEEVFGARRTILDDFTVPEGQTWVLQDFMWYNAWTNGLPAGTGEGLSMQIVRDFGGNPDLLALEVVGTAFMKNMVRIMAGTLVEVGRGRLRIDDVRALLTPDGRRDDAGETAPAHGLTLVSVTLGRLREPASRSAP